MTTRISQLAPLASPATDDLLPVLDVHDNGQSSAGTTKKATLLSLLSAATLGGDLTGTLPSPTVAKLHGLAVGTSPGGTSTFLRADGTWAAPAGSAPSTDWINAVATYGADPTGVADSRSAIQNAINAAAVLGTAVYLPAGTYSIGSPLTMTSLVSVFGAGKYATILQLKNGVNDYLLKFTQGTGISINGAKFCDFTINGNASNQTAGGGINAGGAVECNFERIRFTNCYNWGLVLGPIPGGAFGHHNRIFSCTFDNAANAGFGGGGWATSCDENYWDACDFQYLGGAAAPVGSYPVMLLDQAGLQLIENCVFVGSRGSNTDVIAVRTHNAGQSRVIGCTFDGVGGDCYFTNNADCIVVGNTFTSVGDQAATAGWAAGVHLEFGTARCTVTGNNLSSSATNGKTGYLIREDSSGGGGSNVIQGNTLRVRGSLATGTIVSQGAASIVRANIGYNPVGALTAGWTLPGSGTPLVNPSNVDAQVWIVCGGGVTVSVVKVNGQTIPVTVAAASTSPAVFVPAGGSLTVTYAGGTPTLTVNGN